MFMDMLSESVDADTNLTRLFHIPNQTAYRFLRRIGTRKKCKAKEVDSRWDLEAGREGGGGAEPSSQQHEADRVNLMLLGPTEPLPFFTDLPPPRLEERKMFVTTFNAGECTLASIIDNIPDWIPKDLAVYVRSRVSVSMSCLAFIRSPIIIISTLRQAGDWVSGVPDPGEPQAGHRRPPGARHLHVVRELM